MIIISCWEKSSRELNENLTCLKAEAVGFEPTSPIKSHQFSELAPSTTRSHFLRLIVFIPIWKSRYLDLEKRSKFRLIQSHNQSTVGRIRTYNNQLWRLAFIHLNFDSSSRESGIRTHGGITSTVFKTVTLNHSVTSP
jgi:hypothetical protein